MSACVLTFPKSSIKDSWKINIRRRRRRTNPTLSVLSIPYFIDNICTKPLFIKDPGLI